jgi:hypothetical protein
MFIHVRWSLIVAAAGLCATVVVAPAAHAVDTEPVAGCPASFNLSAVDDAIDAVDRRIYDDDTWSELIPVIAALDENGDGLLCWRHWGTNSGRDKKWGEDEYIVTLIGDNTRAGRLDKSVVV